MERKVSNFQILMFVILRQKILLCPWTLEMWTQAASRYFSSVYVFHALYISSCSLLNMPRAQQQTQKMKKNVAYPLKKESSKKKNWNMCIYVVKETFTYLQYNTCIRKFKTHINLLLKKYSWLFLLNIITISEHSWKERVCVCFSLYSVSV